MKTKSCIASKILTFIKPTDFKNSKPKQPVVVDTTTTLESLVGAKSWTLFHILGIKTDWLEKSPSVWPEYSDYMEVCDWVRSAKVVNDSCDRLLRLFRIFVILSLLIGRLEGDYSKQWLLLGNSSPILKRKHSTSNDIMYSYSVTHLASNEILALL